jgi:hypothetical protein
MDAVHRHKALSALGWIVTILWRYCATAFMVLALQLKLRHPHWLLYSEVPLGVARPVSRKSCSNETHSRLDHSIRIRQRVSPCVSSGSNVTDSVP